MSDRRLIVVGRFGAPHGVRGQIGLNSFMTTPTDIVAYGPVFDDRGARALTLTLVGTKKNQLIVSIAGITTRDEAQRLTNMLVHLPRDLLPETEDGEFYCIDLIGLAVRDARGAAIGAVKDVCNFGAGDLVNIMFDDGRDEFFSFSTTVFPEVNTDEGFVTFVPPAEVIVDEEKTA